MEVGRRERASSFPGAPVARNALDGGFWLPKRILLGVLVAFSSFFLPFCQVQLEVGERANNPGSYRPPHRLTEWPGLYALSDPTS